MFERFEDIEAWQRGRTLSDDVYEATYNEQFQRDSSLVDQIRRAVNSISLNISEGHNRETDKEFIQFLYYSHASAGEVQGALYLAKDKNYISEDTFRKLYDDAEETSKMIMGLIKHLRQE